MRVLIALAAVVAAALAVPSAAPALPLGIPSEEVHVITAYGEGVTTCVVRMTFVDEYPKDYNRYSAGTECNAPIQQTGKAFLLGDWGVISEGELCSRFATTCGSGTSDFGDRLHGRYDITLRAPFGQGWAVPPNINCSGAGTDYLICSL